MSLPFNDQDVSTQDGPRALGIKAVAEAKNPLGKVLHGHIGYNLPLGIFLPVEQSDLKEAASGAENSTVLLAAVATEPLTITGETIIPLSILGRVVPLQLESRWDLRATMISQRTPKDGDLSSLN